MLARSLMIRLGDAWRRIGRQVRRRPLGAAMLALALLALVGAAGAYAIYETRSRPQVIASDPMQPPTADCAEWTDACRVCVSGEGGSSCSNVGIACQPKPMTCTRPAPPAVAK